MSTTSEGRPGRYQRTTGGLVAALVITVVGVGGLLWVLGLFRPDVEIEREPVDYLGLVRDLQRVAPVDPVYPASLPDGWIATDVDTSEGLQIKLLTDDEKFAAVHQEKTSAEQLLERYVDEDVTTTDIIEVEGSVAEAWQGYEDDGGDTAYASTVGDDTILVFGSASAEELQDLIGRLTTAPVADSR